MCRLVRHALPFLTKTFNKLKNFSNGKTNKRAPAAFQEHPDVLYAVIRTAMPHLVFHILKS
jgi:hypothetical protein